jgi:Ohr subfamily peroxiredoxin
MSIFYTARATSVSGRDGRVETDDKALVLDIVRPGSGKTGTNPEQLFACAYAACFGGAVRAVAGKMGVEPGEVQVDVEVSLFQEEESYSLSITTLNAILSQVDEKTAAKVVAGAHEICPYSRALRNNVNVTLFANGEKVMEFIPHGVDGGQRPRPSANA